MQTNDFYTFYKHLQYQLRASVNLSFICTREFTNYKHYNFMAKILINDGIHPTGARMLTEAGHTVDLQNIPQDQLKDRLQEYDGICVRSATKVRTELIDMCPGLKFIGRGGVGLDNIDVDHARSKNIAVINTPAASSRSVAELAVSHMMSLSRFVYQSNREMPTHGATEFKSLKKSYSKGQELEGKTLGVIGLGRIGQEAAKIALGLGMNVMGVDLFTKSADIKFNIGGHEFTHILEAVSLDEMLANADYITLHIPFTGSPALGAAEFAKMKKGVIIANAARGGTIDEDALLSALNDGTVAAAGLDVFENEPSPRQDLLDHSRVSLTPHIGASTAEAQEKIGIELAEKIMAVLD